MEHIPFQLGIIHGCLSVSNIVRIRSKLAFIDLSSAIITSQNGDITSSLMKNKFGRISQDFKSAILPPEMIFKIDLKENKTQLLQYETYWKHLSSDAITMKSLTPNDVKAIDDILCSLLSRSNSEGTDVGHETPLRNSMSASQLNIKYTDKEDWQTILSRSLTNITFDDMPESLSTCKSMMDFLNAWERMKRNSKLWAKIRPRLSSGGQFAYVIKCFDDTGTLLDHDTLPYDHIMATEKIDLWAFGVLLLTMSSGGSLFHQNQDGHLANTWSFEELYNWGEKVAKEKIQSVIDDPVIQDLLIKLLAPENERLSSMKQVLKHPFFDSSSEMEIQKIVKRYDEEKVRKDTIQQTTTQNSKEKRALNSMEKTCKIVFDRLDHIMIPTCFIILPYKIERTTTAEKIELKTGHQRFLAERIGFHLLNINAATAKLMFWLKVKESLSKENGKVFKAKIISWINRARNESSSLIAKEIIADLGQNANYEGICVEMLDEAMDISKAAEFMKDPVGAARSTIFQHTSDLLDCYTEQYLYVIDEYDGIPVLDLKELYPIKIDDAKIVRNVMMPFINMSIMSVVATFGMEGVAKLVGLTEIPDSWIKCSLGLIQQDSSMYDGGSILDFAILQELLRKRDLQTGLSFRSIASSAEEEKVQQSYLNDNLVEGLELLQLEIFFNEHDAMGSYAGLHRYYEDEDNSVIIWTRNLKGYYSQCQDSGNDDIQTIERLNELQQEIVKKKRVEGEIMILLAKIKDMKIKAEKKLAAKRTTTKSILRNKSKIYNA